MIALLATTGFYTALGGVHTSSYVEFVQTLVLLLALMLALPVVVYHAGGLQRSASTSDRSIRASPAGGSAGASCWHSAWRSGCRLPRRRTR